jgi:hypothetical protein
LSSAAVGSSARIKPGSPASARATATRWRCPPESLAGGASARSPTPTASSKRAGARQPLLLARRGVQFQRHGHVLPRRQEAEQVVLLEDEAYAPAERHAPPLGRARELLPRAPRRCPSAPRAARRSG